MAKSLLIASLMAAGVYAQSTPDPSLIKGGEFQHLGCVAIKPGTFPRQFDLGQAGCTSSCSTNGNIIAFHGNSCACDRLDLSPKPIPYRVTKVDNALCNQWCDPADKSKGTCGGATTRGWPVYDLYKRNDARVVFVPFPGDVTTPVAPGQTPAPVPNDPGHKPGDVFLDCPPDVVDCPYRTKCPGRNCGGAKPIPKPCHGCNPGGQNWTAPGCAPGGCSPGQGPTPGGGDQNGNGGGGNGAGSGNDGGSGGDNNAGAGGNDGQDGGNGSQGGHDSGSNSQGGQGDSGGGSGGDGNQGSGGDAGNGSGSDSGSDATGGQDGPDQGGAGQDQNGAGQGDDGSDSGSSAGGAGGSDQGSQGQGSGDGGDQSDCSGTACPTPVSLAFKAEAGSFMFTVVAVVLGFGLW